MPSSAQHKNRLAKERSLKERTYHHYAESGTWKRHLSIRNVMRKTAKFSGLNWFARRNLRNYEITELAWGEATDHSLKVLHLSDLHFPENDTARVDRQSLVAACKNLSADICVITGDLRDKSFGSFDVCVAEIAELIASLSLPTFIVLGNHDSIEMKEPLVAAGATVLVNENIIYDADGIAVLIGGVDDPHYYEADDPIAALRTDTHVAFKLLLAHSPEVMLKDAAQDADLVLCGHTHGGQVCLPGGNPILANIRAPRFLVRGQWKFVATDGFTSRGCGTTLLPLRLNCRPEIAVHKIFLA